MDIVGIPSHLLDAVWNDVKDRVAEVLDRFSDDEYTVDDIEKMIRNRDAQLWTSTDNDCIYITQIVNKKTYKELFGWVFQADALKEEHWEIWECVKAWGRANGCTKSRVVCRPGFEKAFVKHGWKKRHVTLVQEI